MIYGKETFERFLGCHLNRRGVSLLLARAAVLLFGLVVIAIGLLLTVNTTWGVAPWDVLHKSVARITGIQYGSIQQLTGMVLIVITIALGGQRFIRLGTILNMLMVGQFVKWFSTLGLFPVATGWHGLLQLVFGISVHGFGGALYLAAALGAGPRDSLMLTMTGKTKGPVWLVKSSLDFSAFCTGWVLGGPAGIGTVLYALLLGPNISFFMKWLQPIQVYFQGFIPVHRGQASTRTFTGGAVVPAIPGPLDDQAQA